LQIAELLEWVNASQKWLTTHKVGPTLQKICEKRFGTSRQFIFPAETRFGGKLLQLKRFSDMREALQELVVSQSYTRHNFADDNVKDRISDNDLWQLIGRITKAAGPVLLLLRLGDANQATLSKLKGTVDYIKTLLVDTGEDTLEDKVAAAFHNRAEELECDVSSAAYLLDPQFVAKSRHAPPAVMSAFFRVSLSVLCPKGDDAVWRTLRQQLVTQLASFRMKTGGLAMEDYTMIDACVFWGAAGCYAPLLRQLAFALAALPCSSGEAERNWNEVKQNLVKNRNRLGSARLEKMVFV